MTTRFQQREYYAAGPDSRKYHLLPFRFMRWPDGDVLVVNVAGEYEFVPRLAFAQLVSHTLPAIDPAYRDLKAKHFITDTPSSVPLDLLATKYRTKLSFLNGLSKLHLFVVTLRCDHSCPYCQVSRVTEDRITYDMTRDTADRAINLMFQSPAPAMKIEFQGGEPLLNFDLIQYVVDRTKKLNLTQGRDIEFVIATNLSPLTDEMLEYCKSQEISLSTSLDGPAFLHDTNRPRRGGGSHARTISNLERARSILGRDRISALMTTTAKSLAYPREIIDEYVKLDFTAVFLRPISPYGFALRTPQMSFYASERFLEFYKEGLDHIIGINRQGTPLVEVYTQILLRKILTPFPTGYVDLQSPAGAGINVVAYNYDGNVYASDEARMLAEMGDTTFRLGNVHNRYEELFHGSTMQALVQASVAETLPGCTDCAFLPYCGADPIYHWATQSDPIGHRPTSGFCAKNMGIFRHLFGLLKTGDEFTKRLFVRWATAEGWSSGSKRIEQPDSLGDS